MLDDNNVVIVDTKKRRLVNLGELVNSANSNVECKGIYFVKMNVSDMEKRIARTTHELRPFVAVEKAADGKLKGYYTTSNLRKFEFSRYSLKKYRTVLSSKKYKLNKSSLVLLEKISTIDVNKILREIDYIDNDDLAKLIKMRNLFDGNCLKLKGKYLCIGDVVFDSGKKYLIYQNDNSFVYGFRIEFKGKRLNSKTNFNSSCCFCDCDGELYRVYFDELKAFSKSKSFILCDYMMEDVVDFVKSRRMKSKHSNKGNKHGSRSRRR